MNLLGLDLGINRTGFAVGDGSADPEVGAWRFPPAGEDLAALGVPFWRRLSALHARTPVGLVMYEAPLLDRYRDKVVVLRKTFGLGMLVETWAGLQDPPIPCEEEPFGALKRELTGKAKAGKGDMVAVCERIGIPLPATKADGREDAADGFAAWLVAVRLHARQHLTAWDRRLYSRRSGYLT